MLRITLETQIPRPSGFALAICFLTVFLYYSKSLAAWPLTLAVVAVVVVVCLLLFMLQLPSP